MVRAHRLQPCHKHPLLTAIHFLCVPREEHFSVIKLVVKIPHPTENREDWGVRRVFDLPKDDPPASTIAACHSAARRLDVCMRADLFHSCLAACRRQVEELGASHPASFTITTTARLSFKSLAPSISIDNRKTYRSAEFTRSRMRVHMPAPWGGMTFGQVRSRTSWWRHVMAKLFINYVYL